MGFMDTYISRQDNRVLHRRVLYVVLVLAAALPMFITLVLEGIVKVQSESGGSMRADSDCNLISAEPARSLSSPVANALLSCPSSDPTCASRPTALIFGFPVSTGLQNVPWPDLIVKADLDTARYIQAILDDGGNPQRLGNTSQLLYFVGKTLLADDGSASICSYVVTYGSLFLQVGYPNNNRSPGQTCATWFQSPASAVGFNTNLFRIGQAQFSKFVYVCKVRAFLDLAFKFFSITGSFSTLTMMLLLALLPGIQRYEITYVDPKFSQANKRDSKSSNSGHSTNPPPNLDADSPQQGSSIKLVDMNGLGASNPRIFEEDV